MATLRAATAFLAGIGLAVSLSACSSDADQPAGETSPKVDAAAAYCEGADKVQTELDALIALIDEGAPTQALKEQRDFVLSAIQANALPLSQLPESIQVDLDAANTDFVDSVQAVSEDATPSETSASYLEAVETLEASVRDVEAEIGCA